MKPYLYGLVATFILLGLYTATMTLLSGIDATIEQFQALWYLMVPLALGFGMQVALYTKLKTAIRERANAAIATGGTSAGVSMLACCVHHATDTLPFLGLAGVSIFLVQYQKPILLASITINAIGILIMLNHTRNIYKSHAAAFEL